MMKSIFLSTWAALLYSAAAFSTSSYLGRRGNTIHVTPNTLPLHMGSEEESRVPFFIDHDEERAAVLSSYLTKAHEEKLKAIAEIDKKRKDEINILKQEISLLKSQLLDQSSSLPISMDVSNEITIPVSGTDFASMSKEQLVGVNQQYFNFISKYVVDSSEQKYRAVKAAEASLNAKWEAKLHAMTTESPQPIHADLSISPNILSSTSGIESNLYTTRNAAILRAALAGKSRWGDLEIQRVSKIRSTPIVPSTNIPQTETKSIEKTLFTMRNDFITAADAVGKSRWGSMEIEKAKSNLSIISQSAAINAKAVESDLYQMRNVAVASAGAAKKSRWGDLEVQRVSGGLGTVTLKAKTVETDLYQKRNVAVASAGVAKMSRWGDLEVQRVSVGLVSQQISTPVSNSNFKIIVSPEVEAADHGLRADGGVDGLTLAERVSFGSNAPLNSVDHKGTTQHISPSTFSIESSHSSLYNQRNLAVIVAAGKSRWGSKELERITKLESNIAVNSVAATHPIQIDFIVPVEVEAADHGLRADGGVGGLTLAERVVFGHTVNSFIEPSSSINRNGASQHEFSSSSSLYEKRNKRVVDAGVAGMARWGNKELDNLKTSATNVAVNGVVDLPINMKIPQEVEDADHGLRADGGVRGLTLAERVIFGHKASSSSFSSLPKTKVGVSESMTSTSSSLFDRRNTAVMMAGAAGKSRWGNAEVERINALGIKINNNVAITNEISRINYPVPKEVEAADHGLRADGGVGGLTLAERVAFGHSASSNGSVEHKPSAASESSSSSQGLFGQRNAKVLAASEAGKARWGNKEVSKIATSLTHTISIKNGSTGVNGDIHQIVNGHFSAQLPSFS